MQYETEIGVQSDPRNVSAEAARLLVGCGFQLAREDSHELKLTGPGMRSTKQNAILGATSITLIERDHPKRKIIVHADLGGVRWMGKFILWFPILLSFGLVLGFASVLGAMQLAGGVPVPRRAVEVLAATFVCLTLPWVLLRPMLVKSIRRKTEQAIVDTILSADQMARHKSDQPAASPIE